MSNPYLETFNHVIDVSKQCGYATFDYLPDENEHYPFVFVGAQNNTDIYTKTRVLGRTTIQLDVYGGYKQRQQVSDMLEKLLGCILQRNATENFKYVLYNSDSRIVSDISTDEPLWHGILNVELKIL